MSKLKPRIPLVHKVVDGYIVPVVRPSRAQPTITMIDGKPHRMRRGKLVEIPAEWFGKVTHKQTIRKRPSKKGQGASYISKDKR